MNSRTDNNDVASVRVDFRLVERFVAQVFQRLDVPTEDAQVFAQSLVFADVHGIESHGVARLSRYIEGLEGGVINPRPQLQRVENTPAMARIDGDNGLGQVVATRAMELAIEKASKVGIAAVTVFRSNHFGAAGYYALMAVPHGQIGVSLTNGHRRVVPPGGQVPRFGTNPIAVAVPTGSGQDPWLLDMATSVVSRGKIETAQRHGELIPEGWAVDASGLPTQDPDVLLREGSSLPLGGRLLLGGHKGYGLGVLVDILSGVLSGANYGGDFNDRWGDGIADNLGHFFLAMDVSTLLPLPIFTSRMNEMIATLRNTPLVEGEPRIQVHGEPEFRAARHNSEHGIPLDPVTLAMLREVAERWNLQPPA